MATRIVKDLGTFDPDMKLAGGAYLFEIREASFDTFANSGRDCLVLEGELVEGPEQPSGIEVAGRKQTVKMGFPKPDDKPTTKNMMGGRIRRLLEAVGDFDNVESGQVDTTKLDGQVICIVFKDRKDSNFLDADKFLPASDYVPSVGGSGSGSDAGSSLY